MRVSLLSRQEFGSLARYQQFIVVMMVAYALGMAGLTVLLAARGRAVAVGTLAVAVGIGGAALTVVPAALR